MVYFRKFTRYMCRCAGKNKRVSIKRSLNYVFTLLIQLIQYIVDGTPGCMISGTVRFGKDDSIPPNRAVDRTKLRPVSDHVLTPISTPCVIGKVISTEKCSEMKLVESLLNRLLDDLNRGRLTEEEVNLLTGYAMDVVYNRIKGVGVSYDMGKIAESVVEFTLEKILNDIRSDNVPHEEVTEMAALMICKRMESDASDISISSDDDQLQVLLSKLLTFFINVYNYELGCKFSFENLVLK